MVLGVKRLGLSSHCGLICLYVVSRAWFPGPGPKVSNLARIAVLVAMIIYVMAGRYVWTKRDALDGFLNPFNEDPFTGVMMTTEVTITSQERKLSLPNFTVRETDEGAKDDEYDAYSINIGTQRPRRPSRPAVFRIPSVTRAVALSQENVESFLYARVAFLFFIALLITWYMSR